MFFRQIFAQFQFFFAQFPKISFRWASLAASVAAGAAWSNMGLEVWNTLAFILSDSATTMKWVEEKNSPKITPKLKIMFFQQHFVKFSIFLRSKFQKIRFRSARSSSFSKVPRPSFPSSPRTVIPVEEK